MLNYDTKVEKSKLLNRNKTCRMWKQVAGAGGCYPRIFLRTELQRNKIWTFKPEYDKIQIAVLGFFLAIEGSVHMGKKYFIVCNIYVLCTFNTLGDKVA